MTASPERSPSEPQDGAPRAPRLVLAGEVSAVGDSVAQSKTVVTPMRCSKCGDLIEAGQRAALVEFAPGRVLGWMCDSHGDETRKPHESPT